MDEKLAHGGRFMKNDLKHKLYMGFRGLMMRIPPLLSDKGARKGEKGAKANADTLSDEERRVHHFMNLSKRALTGVKRMQTAIFGFNAI